MLTVFFQFRGYYLKFKCNFKLSKFLLLHWNRKMENSTDLKTIFNLSFLSSELFWLLAFGSSFSNDSSEDEEFERLASLNCIVFSISFISSWILIIRLCFCSSISFRTFFSSPYVPLIF